MPFRLILFAILQTAYSYDTESSEGNRFDFTPLYDTIILSDVADIINEFENNLNGPLEGIDNSASESEENVEDLLSEYQKYLEKAHKQRVNYHEKNKSKNKVPAIRRDRFAKIKPGINAKYDDYFYANNYLNNYYSPDKYPVLPISNPMDIFIPMNTNTIRYLNKFDLTTQQPKEKHDEFSIIEKKLIELPPVFQNQNPESIKSLCFCKNPQLPCDCKCKQCIMPFESTPQNKIQRGENTAQGYTESTSSDRLRDIDNTLNIRIKVDIQIPKTQESVGRFLKNRSREDIGSSKESSLNLPFPYFNFPIPMDIFGYKRMTKGMPHEAGHKITIHKKKKPRVSNGSKKHRKKLVTFHNLNIQPQGSVKLHPYIDESFNWTEMTEKSNNTKQVMNNNSTGNHEPNTNVSINNTVVPNNTKEHNGLNDTQKEENIFVMVNISNVSDNATEDVHKIENSLENEYTKAELPVTSEKLPSQRRKREIAKKLADKSLKKVTTKNTYQKIIKKPYSHKVLASVKPNVNHNNKTDIVANISANATLLPANESKTKNDTKKSDKLILADTELVYWPIVFRNQSSLLHTKNITKIILERENKKAKVNMSKEAIRNNRTKVLEKAIFGDINWDDVDTVAPVFMSFVGKYLRGVLTFCSQNVCHSMKCAEKTCAHRVCVPDERWNSRGHCSGSNATDSIASLESILDLPSNVVFEIVDILQDKMLGKLFGKVTLCISSKCISFVANKKNFLKSKCSVKELKIGHCPNIKNFKII